MHLIFAPVLFSSMPHAAVGGLLAFLDCLAAYFQQSERKAVAHSMAVRVCDDAVDCTAQRLRRRKASPVVSTFNIPRRAAQRVCVQYLHAAHAQAVH
ncbi:hypothetical protein [Xanthomonas hortorum]|uniref:Uncharacterized protein n=1 Tax=Xanthomonas hortorum pv. hederae TaxID=453603 RepID=A0A9X4BS85_9XANT|nr:hypothetical protein [Xanthomonas hortorum]MCE4371522.1 hypothetical protein [Xanthomonas hortorum pv. hederae]MDC8638595.1 hypothetical protein [Xanthomonas hortorum pv. hederae]